MVLSRAIPCLLVHQGGLVKTVRFKNPTYIGDPINAIKIFNEKEVDELIVLDIDATAAKREPDYKLIEDLASECFMPLCYGGGVTKIEQMRKIYGLGVEKISLSSAAIESPGLIESAAKIFGSQSVVVTLDLKKTLFQANTIVTHNGKKKYKGDVMETVLQMQNAGAGEIVINSVDRDGMMQGYDIDLLKRIRDAVNVPIIALGGAGKLEDMARMIEFSGVSAAAAGSIFVYHGPLKGVLINYPGYETLRELFNE